MRRQIRCMTNNPMLTKKEFPELEYYQTDILGLFQLIETEIQSGNRLLSHPLTGSIRPDITPYKTVLLSSKKEEIDVFSLRLIREAIRYTKDLYKLRKTPLYQCWGKEAQKDFQMIDLSLIRQGLEVEGIH